MPWFRIFGAGNMAGCLGRRCLPLRDRREVAVEEALPGSAASNLPTRRRGNGRRFCENDCVRTDFVVFGHCGADRGEPLVGVDVTGPVAVDFLHDDELLGGIRIERDRKSSPTTA